jgi:hypothetical protein
MKSDMIDHHDLDSLESEYIELYLAYLTDDVDCSPSTIKRREDRLAEIEEDVGVFVSGDWANKTHEKANDIGYASGKPWDGNEMG